MSATLEATVEVYLLNQLDDHRGYCIDIKGSKSNANPENGLQAHTCYSYQGEISVDQAAGLTIGVEYAPDTIALEKETREIPTGRTDSGNQVIDAEVEDLYTVYIALPFGETGMYARAGYMSATMNTIETLATGSTYGNVDIEGSGNAQTIPPSLRGWWLMEL